MQWLRSASDTRLRQVVVLAGLCTVILVRWWGYLGSTAALGDEGLYLRAFRAVAAGGSASEISGFYYPATFSALGGWSIGVLGEPGTRLLMRSASVLGLAVTVWAASCLAPVSWIWRLTLGAVYVSLAPGVFYGIETGNLSFAISGMIVGALLLWPRAPITAGVLLGVSSAIKPLAPLAIVALGSHRPLPATRRQLVTAAVGAGLTLTFLLADSTYLATSPGAVDRLPFIRSISLNRILSLLGLEIRPVWIAVIVAAVIAVVARMFPMDRKTMLCFGGLSAVMAVPIIWSHTLILTLPLQVFALDRAMTRRRWAQACARDKSRSKPRWVWLRYEVFFVTLAVIALQTTEGAGAVDDQSVAFQLIVLTGAYLAAPLLMAYVLATGSRSSGASEFGPFKAPN